MPESKIDQEITRVAEQIKLEKERKVQLEKEIKEKLKSMTSSSGVKKGIGKWRKQDMKTTSWRDSSYTASQECNFF